MKNRNALAGLMASFLHHHHNTGDEPMMASLCNEIGAMCNDEAPAPPRRQASAPRPAGRVPREDVTQMMVSSVNGAYPEGTKVI